MGATTNNELTTAASPPSNGPQNKGQTQSANATGATTNNE